MFKDRSFEGPKDIASGLTRAAVCVVFVVSGVTKFAMYPEQVELFVEWGVPFPEILVPVVGAIELAGGIATAVGFLARVAAAVLASVMVVAFLTAGPNGLNIVSFALCVVVAALGPRGWYVLTERGALNRLT